ncbi:MAG TPA: ATP synthase F1 subunit epsilon [Alphaproteobacteria bacterium]|jgi:F-type H+-transporting ATPase subunit epsilon|nr:ATP synthase F1 subunit epsilon [Alphaproteobacteria bacterium]HIA22075.1 ATP synthase F1 subunit epsilon [Alphaproteobacteria bacterium]HIB19460.1 ATP synthase F1 subunit epsilon [Alphaproteobacteria bacterium]HIB57585.1 ATP synthase F1 subunit epsilon [Alphaproteobacteria bacterium]HIN93844.1 ATP synthase F1 subunit epsilon [Alphaproteobacteria bacterium]
MADKVEFELVSPERLLVSQGVDMVVVPGEDGDFGVLPGHALFLSGVRPGVIEIYDGDKISDRIFVAGGFAEVTGERCTVLAEEAVNLAEVERTTVEARIRDNEQAISIASPDEDVSSYRIDLGIGRALLEALENK